MQQDRAARNANPVKSVANIQKLMFSGFSAQNTHDFFNFALLNRLLVKTYVYRKIVNGSSL